MTVASTTNRVSYAGNGTTTDFAFPHPYRASSDLVVTLRTTATGAEVAQVEGVNYTVLGTPTSDAGGFASATVSFGTAPASGTQVHIDRIVARTQTTDYVAGDGIPPSSIEGSLDKLTQLVQELDSRFERTLLQPRTAANRNLVLPEPTSGTASRVLAVNAGGTAYELRAPDGIPNGDKGDITVSGAGDTWTIDANAVTTAKIADGAVTAAKIGDAELSALAGLTSAANKLPYFTGSGTAALADLTVAGRDLIAGADATAQRGTLGLGTIATQAANNVSITGGSITNITDLAIADGGTGASTASGARANLGLSDGANLNFTQTGTGAVTRSIDARLKDWISVKDFGVVADGTDQTTKIQAAIDAAAAAGGGVIYFPPGTYTISSSINLKSNVVLDGGNRKATLSMTHTNTDPRNTAGQRYSSNTVGVNITGETAGGFTPLDNTGIVGFRITHANPSGGKVLSAITARNVTNLIISDNEIFGFNCMVTGIRLASIIGGEIKDNIVRDCVMSDGMTGYIETYTGITGTTVPASGTLSLAASLGAPALVRVQASGNNLRPSRSFTYNAGTQNITLGSAATATDTIYVQYGLAQSNGIEVDNDRINSIGSEQLLISGNRVADVRFTGTAYNNWFMETDGIQLGGSVARCTISDNVIHDVGEGVDTFSKYCSFNGNHVSNCGLFGIKLTHGASFNTITNTSVDGAGLAGLVIVGSSVNLTPCDGNVVSNISIQRLNYNTTFLAADCAAVAYSEQSATYTVSNTVLADVSADCGANAQFGFRNTTTSGNNNHSGLRIKGTHASFTPGTTLSFASNGGRNYAVNLTPGSPIITMRFDDNALLEQVRNVNNGLNASATTGSPQGIRYETLLGTTSAQNIVAYRINVNAVADWNTGANRNTRLETSTSVAGSLVIRSVTNETGTSFGGATAAGDPDAALTVNGVASFGDGTAAVPSVAHRGDLNTGVYFPSAGDAVGITAGGTMQLYANTTGIGINTTGISASTKLHVVNTSAGAVSYAAYLQNSDNTSNTEVRLAIAANTNALGVGGSERHAYIAALNAGGTNSNALKFATNEGGNTPVERLRVKQTGSVRFVPLATAPSGPEAGDVYYDSTTNKLRCYNGTTWNDLF